MAKTRINYKSDIPPLDVTFKINGVTSPVPSHDFLVRFFIAGEVSNNYVCSYINGTYNNCEKANSTTLTCYIDNHKFGCGRLCCEYVDIYSNSKYTDGAMKTVTPNNLDIYLVDGPGDSASEVRASIAVSIETILSDISALQSGKQDKLTFDSTPTESSTNPVTSGGVYTALSGKQDTLTFDSSPTQSSTNPVTSGGVYTALSGKQDTLTFDDTPTASSSNPVKSGGIYTTLQGKQNTLVSGVSIKTINSTSLLGNGDVSVQPTLISGSNIKTINNESILGSGNITIQGGSGGGSGDVAFKVTITTITSLEDDSTSYVSDKTVAEILAAYQAGRQVIAVNGNEEYGIYTLSAVTDTVALFESTLASANQMVSFEITSSGVTFTVSELQSELTFDNAPTSGSNNPVKSGGIYTALAGKQATLVSGTNIKTINSTSLLGSGNIIINGVTGITTQQDGTIVFALTNGDTYTLDLNHTHSAIDGTAIQTGTSTSNGMVSPKTLRDNFYTEGEIDTMIGNIETLLAAI